MNDEHVQKWLALGEKLEEHYLAGEFDKIDQILKDVDLNTTSAQDIVGYLMITFRAKDKLAYRKTFAEQAEKELMKRPEWKSKDFVEGFRMIARSE